MMVTLNDLIKRIDDIEYVDKFIKKISDYKDFLLDIPEEKLTIRQRLWLMRYYVYEDQICGIPLSEVPVKIFGLFKLIPKRQETKL